MNNNHHNNQTEDSKSKVQTKESLSDYELYCQQQVEAFEDELGDERCFGSMAEGVFVRGH